MTRSELEYIAFHAGIQAKVTRKRETDCEADLRNVAGEQWKGLATCWIDGWELAAPTVNPITAREAIYRNRIPDALISRDLFGWVRAAFWIARRHSRHGKLVDPSRTSFPLPRARHSSPEGWCLFDGP